MDVLDKIDSRVDILVLEGDTAAVFANGLLWLLSSSL